MRAVNQALCSSFLIKLVLYVMPSAEAYNSTAEEKHTNKNSPSSLIGTKGYGFRVTTLLRLYEI
jgi:hypothetical protein